MRYSCLLYFDPILMCFHHQEKADMMQANGSNVLHRYHPFELVTWLYFSAPPVEVNLIRSICDMCEHCVEVAQYTHNDRRLLFVLMLTNHFSPQRFLGEPQLLPVVLKLHSKLVQFMRQYCQLMCSMDPTLGARETRVRFNAADALLASFQSASLRAQVAPLFSRRSILSLLHPLPVSATESVAERALWLFQFCIAVLNDVRLHEPSIQDFLALRKAFEQIAPLSSELLDRSPF